MSGVRVVRPKDERVRWSSAPFFILHLLAFGVFFVPFSWDCVVLCVAMYYLRMFGITAGYHRYFSHRGYKTGRVFQFVLAWLGLMSSQKGVLWWSGLHRHHHKYSDMPEDIHSPRRGFWWSHMLWFIVPKYEDTPESQLREFSAYPELLFINKYWFVGPTFLGVVLFLIGSWSWLFWGFFLSTVLLWHGTFTINSLAHVWGRVRYETGDTSRNNFFLSLITMGEGWHNNHHFYQSTANNGFFWWEIDMSYYVLKVLSWFGIVWDLRTPPEWALAGLHSAHDPMPTRPRLDALRDSVAALRKQAEQAAQDAADSAAAFRQRVAERAAEIAESAAKAANDAAESARGSAQELRHRFAKRAAEAAANAAQHAQDASDAASRMAADVRTRVSEAVADAARRAQAAAEAARQAASAAAEAAAAATQPASAS